MKCGYRWIAPRAIEHKRVVWDAPQVCVLPKDHAGDHQSSTKVTHPPTPAEEDATAKLERIVKAKRFEERCIVDDGPDEPLGFFDGWNAALDAIVKAWKEET